MEMTDDDTRRWRERLLQLRAELEGREATSRSSAGTVVLDQTSVGRLSRMDALQGQQMARESERRRMAGLRAVDAALARLAAGDFGLCTECGEPIAEGRLRFDPTTPHCIGCAA